MLTNSDMKRLRSLTRKKFREQYGQYLIEGHRLIVAALESQAPLLETYVTPAFLEHPGHQELIHRLDNLFIPYMVIIESTMKKLTSTVSPPGILGVCSFPDMLTPEPKNHLNWLYLDHISDPGNLGTLLRAAAWFNVTPVALSPESIDPYNPKVVRGGMGAHFALTLFTNVMLSQLCDGSHTILGADQRGQPLPRLKLPSDTPWILVLGSEAHGLSPETIPLLTHTVSIPRLGRGESLNVAMAGGILLYQLTMGR